MARKKGKAKPKAEPVAVVPEPPSPPEVVPPSRLQSGRQLPWRWLTQAGIGLFLSVGLLAGVVGLGQMARLEIAGDGRYAVRFTDIVCDSPPGVERSLFLTEVRYLGRLPERVQSVAPELPAQLTEAFSAHPWVSQVNRVESTADGAIHVALTFRKPVLVVRVANDPEPRTVDASGVLLPLHPVNPELAELEPVVPPPTKPAGQVWADPDVIRAAELAVEFQPRLVEKTREGWLITRTDGSALRVSR